MIIVYVSGVVELLKVFKMGWVVWILVEKSFLGFLLCILMLMVMVDGVFVIEEKVMLDKLSSKYFNYIEIKGWEGMFDDLMNLEWIFEDIVVFDWFLVVKLVYMVIFFSWEDYCFLVNLVEWKVFDWLI